MEPSTTTQAGKPVSREWQHQHGVQALHHEGEPSTPAQGTDTDPFNVLAEEMPTGAVDVLGVRANPNPLYMPGSRTWADFKALEIPVDIFPLVRKGRNTLVSRPTDSTFWVYCRGKKVANMTPVFHRLMGPSGRFLVCGPRTIFFFCKNGSVGTITRTRWDGMFGLLSLGDCNIPEEFEASEWLCHGMAALGVFAHQANGIGRRLILVYFDSVDRRENGCKYFRQVDIDGRQGKLKIVPFITYSYFGAVVVREDSMMDCYWYCRTNAPRLRKLLAREVASFDRGISTSSERDILYIVDGETFKRHDLNLKSAEVSSTLLQVAKARYWGPGRIFHFMICSTFIVVAGDWHGILHVRVFDGGKLAKWIRVRDLQAVETTHDSGGILLNDRNSRLGFLDLTKLCKGMQDQSHFLPAGEIFM